MANLNARGVFDSIGDFGEIAAKDLPPVRSFADADDDVETQMYQPRAQRGRRMPEPVRVARRPEAKVVAPAARPSRAPSLLDLETEIPRAPRVPAIQLETVPARAPRVSIAAPTESTPALAFDPESGEYATRTPTMPVPRSIAPKPARLPYLAAGMLALAAGAVVVLLAGVGKKSSFPEAWQSGAAAQSAAAQALAAPARVTASMAPPAAYPAERIVTQDETAIVTTRPLPAGFVPGPAAKPAPHVPAAKPVVAAKPAPKAPAVVAAKPAPAPAPKADKSAKPSKVADEDIAQSQQVGGAAKEALDTSL